VELKSDTIDRLRLLKDRGAVFEAAEMAVRVLQDGDSAPAPGSRDHDEISYLHVVCVATSGSLSKAQELYDTYDIAERRQAKARSVGARLAKARAFRASGTNRTIELRAAAQAYEAAYVHTRGRIGAVDSEGVSSPESIWTAYLLVNAATLHLLAGDRAKADNWAQAAFDVATAATPLSEKESFYRHAIAAEAALLCGRADDATSWLAHMHHTDSTLYADRSRRYAQLKLVCQALDIDDDLLAPLKVPDVIYYAGHIISPKGAGGRFPAEMEDEVRQRIEDYLKSESIGIAFGSLAAGADILFAETCIDMGIDLHLVLPFDVEEFLETSVRPSGGDWEKRFRRCLSWCAQNERHGTASIGQAVAGAFLGDEALFAYGSRYAFGLAMLRARNLQADVRMVAAYDGMRGSDIGTFGSIELCEEHNIRWDHIEIPGGSGARPSVGWREPDTSIPRRRPLAVLFADVESYSDLKEEEVPVFHQHCMTGIAAILDLHADHILDRNSWGDSIFAVFEDALSAVRCGLEIQRHFKQTNFRALGLPRDLGLRLGCHFGPVFSCEDPIRKQQTFYGSHVMRAARIEPITPVGEVYVTEPMAAALALVPEAPIECDYVGLVPLPKDAGELRLYLARDAGA
jgi:class 3 adenylate cyclase